jgi:hypothetical protein
MELAQDVERARQEQAEAQKRSDAAAADYHSRVAELERLNEHKSMWEEEQGRETMMREELELEDHTSRAPAAVILNHATGAGEFDDVDAWVDSAPDFQ